MAGQERCNDREMDGGIAQRLTVPNNKELDVLAQTYPNIFKQIETAQL